MRSITTLMVIVAFAATGTQARVLSTASYNGHVYHLLEEADWYVSEAEAIRLGGHLVTINDADENTWIMDTFGQTARAQGGNGLWLGLNDAETEAQWQWASGEPGSFGQRRDVRLILSERQLSNRCLARSNEPEDLFSFRCEALKRCEVSGRWYA